MDEAELAAEEAAVLIENPLDAVTSEVAQQTQSILHVDALKSIFTRATAVKLGVSLAVIAVLFIVYKLLKGIVNRRLAPKMQAHTKLLVNKVITYVFYILVAMYILSCFGVNLSAVWGAAGVAGLAIGFAAQTSVSNIISGVFVLSEKALRVGDFIEVGGVTGTVDSIGLLSVMIHTLDNQMIRIPNSTIINDTFKNYSHFPIRRMMYDIPISHDADMEAALQAIQRVPAQCPTVLSDPAPVVYYDSFGEAVNMKLGVWIHNGDFLKNKTEVLVAIKKELAKDGLSIPFPRRDVRLVGEEK